MNNYIARLSLRGKFRAIDLVIGGDTSVSTLTVSVAGDSDCPGSDLVRGK